MISFFIVTRAIDSIQLSVGLLLLSEGCILWIEITKQVIGNKESNARKTEAFVLEGKTYSVSHLQSDLQIFQITHSSFLHLIIWIVWFFSPLSCKSLLYKLYMKPLTNMWFTIFFSFQRLPFKFIDGFFTMQKFWLWCCLTSLFLQLFLSFWWLSCLSCLYFGKGSFISCIICYYLLPSLPKDTDWMNGYRKKSYIYSFYRRPTLVLQTHTDWKSEDVRRYSKQMEIKWKPDCQLSCQKK